MISPADFSDSIEGLLKKRFPGEKIYRDLVPEDFARPSHEIECKTFSAVDAGGQEIDVTVTMLINTFVTVDAYHNSQFDALYRRAMAIMGLFAGKYITVSDSDTGEKRAPKVNASACPITGKDYAQVTLTFTLRMDASDFEFEEPSPAAPIMQDYKLSQSI